MVEEAENNTESQSWAVAGQRTERSFFLPFQSVNPRRLLENMEEYGESDIFQHLLGMNLVPRKNATHRYNDTSLSDFSGKLIFLGLI